MSRHSPRSDAWLLVFLSAGAGLGSALAGGCKEGGTGSAVGPDTYIEVSDAPDPVFVDGLVTYTVTVGNKGTTGADVAFQFSVANGNLTGHDPLAGPGPCTTLGDQINCPAIAAPSGTPLVFRVFAMAPSVPGTMTASASVTPRAIWGPDSDASNNTTTVPTTVVAPPPPTLICAPQNIQLESEAGIPATASTTCQGGTPPYLASSPQFPANNGTGTFAGLTLGVVGTDVRMQGTPTQAGTGTAVITVSDNGTPSQAFFVNSSAKIYQPMQITTAQLPGVGVGETYNETVIATGGSGAARFTITQGALPQGLSLNEFTGQIIGTPTIGGSFPIEITAANAEYAQQKTKKSFTIDVIEIETAQLPDGTVGEAYQGTLSTRGNVLGHWHEPGNAGQLPPGISIPYNDYDISVTLSGVPTAAGTYTFTIRSNGLAGGSHARQYTVTIHPSSIFGNELYFTANINHGVSSYLIDQQSGLPQFIATYSAGAHTGAVHLTAAKNQPWLFATYQTSKEVVLFNVDAQGILSEAASASFNEAVFLSTLSFQENCLGVPLQSGGVQLLNASTMAKTQLVPTGGFTPLVTFDPVRNRFAVTVNNDVGFFDVDPTSCTATNTGVTITIPDHRDVAFDPGGAFLWTLSTNVLTNSSTVRAYQLINGLPSGTPGSVSLPSAAFELEPFRIGGYTGVFAGQLNQITPITAQANGSVQLTAEPPVAAPGVDRMILNTDATRVYYNNVSAPSQAQTCWFSTLPAPPLLQAPQACNAKQATGINSSHVIVRKPPTQSPRLRR